VRIIENAAEQVRPATGDGRLGPRHSLVPGALQALLLGDESIVEKQTRVRADREGKIAALHPPRKKEDQKE
jgi:hypothetical protein